MREATRPVHHPHQDMQIASRLGTDPEPRGWGRQDREG
jgi:hypothetical protein